MYCKSQRNIRLFLLLFFMENDNFVNISLLQHYFHLMHSSFPIVNFPFLDDDVPVIWPLHFSFSSFSTYLQYFFFMENDNFVNRCQKWRRRIPLIIRSRHILVSAQSQDLYFQRHMSWHFFLFSEFG